MTREDAIKVLNMVEAYGLADEAKHIAIKALEQEQCDKCEVGNPCLYCKHEFEPKESEEQG